MRCKAGVKGCVPSFGSQLVTQEMTRPAGDVFLVGVSTSCLFFCFSWFMLQLLVNYKGADQSFRNIGFGPTAMKTRSVTKGGSCEADGEAQLAVESMCETELGELIRG